MLQAEVCGTIDDLDRAAINGLSDDGFFTYEWFKSLETSRAFAILPRYFVVYDGSKVVSIAPCFIEYDSQYRTIEESSPWIKRIRKAGNLVGCSFHPPLVCSSPCSFHSRILIQERPDKKAVLNLLCRKIDETCKKERILLSFFPFVSDYDQFLVTNLSDSGYVEIPFISSAYMDIEWSSFEEYVAHFKCRDRKNVRREIVDNRKSGIMIRQEKDFHRLAPILSSLYSNLVFKYTGRAGILGSSFFEALAQHAKSNTRLFTATKDNEVIGFSLCLEHSDILDVYIAGFNYENLSRTDFTYFNLVYYEPIKTAISNGFRRIHFRPGSIQAKLLRGCKIENLHLFTRGHAPFLSPILKQYARVKHRNKKNKQSTLENA